MFLGSAATAWIFGLIADANLSSGAAPEAAYTRIFGFACAMVLVGIAAYMLSPSMARAAAASAKPAA
ncbi:hypothetical protein D3C78_1904010 [compost metagenome]